MQAVWFKGLSKEDKERRKQFLLANVEVFELLEDVLRQSYEDVPTPDYDNPSWAYKQADVNGHNRAIKRVLELIKVTKE